MATDSRQIIVLGPRNIQLPLLELPASVEYVKRDGWLGPVISRQGTFAGVVWLIWVGLTNNVAGVIRVGIGRHLHNSKYCLCNGTFKTKHSYHPIKARIDTSLNVESISTF